MLMLENLGLYSPIISIFQSLRALSYDLDPVRITSANRLRASHMIYETEYTLLSLNQANVNDSQPTSCIHLFEVIPLKNAAYLYLYLVIREIPVASRLITRLVDRLQEALENQSGRWWHLAEERKIWLLWILFMGYSATADRNERWGFVQEVRHVCLELGMSGGQELKDTLKRVLWQEAWCADHCVSLLNDLWILRDSEEGSVTREGLLRREDSTLFVIGTER